MLNWIRKEIGLDDYFENILSGEETKKNKPHPDPYLEMMRRTCVRPKNTIIIEDSDVGLTSALASGAHVIALKGSVPDPILQKAHRIVSKLDEVTLQFLEDLLQDFR